MLSNAKLQTVPKYHCKCLLIIRHYLYPAMVTLIWNYGAWFKLLNSNNPKTNKVGAEQLIKTTHAFRFSTKLKVNASLQHSVTQDQTESCGNRGNWDSTFTFTFLLHLFLILYKGLETDRSVRRALSGVTVSEASTHVWYNTFSQPVSPESRTF